MAEHEGNGLPTEDLPASSPIVTDSSDSLVAGAALGAYTLGEAIGEGASGRVFRAMDIRLKRSVALKVLKGNDPAHRERFPHEAQAQAGLDHENICKIYEAGFLGERPFIAMQLVEGKTLHEARVPMTETQKVEVMRLVTLAVHQAHRRGLIHRDLKPSNIMVEVAEDGSLKPFVTDFGLARGSESGGLTSVGSVMGTPW